LVKFGLTLFSWMRQNYDILHNILHIVLLGLQIVATFWIGFTANAIRNQNYEIQKALYDFELKLVILQMVLFGYMNMNVKQWQMLKY